MRIHDGSGFHLGCQGESRATKLSVASEHFSNATAPLFEYEYDGPAKPDRPPPPATYRGPKRVLTPGVFVDCIWAREQETGGQEGSWELDGGQRRTARKEKGQSRSWPRVKECIRRLVPHLDKKRPPECAQTRVLVFSP